MVKKHSLGITTKGHKPLVISVSGEIDHSNVDALEHELCEHLEKDARIILDLSAVDYIDSAGIAALYAMADALRRRGGQAAIIVTQDRVKKVLDLVRISSMESMTLVDSIAGAKEVLTGESAATD